MTTLCRCIGCHLLPTGRQNGNVLPGKILKLYDNDDDNDDNNDDGNEDDDTDYEFTALKQVRF